MRFLLARLYTPGFLFGFLALAITLQLPSTAWAKAHPTIAPCPVGATSLRMRIRTQG